MDKNTVGKQFQLEKDNYNSLGKNLIEALRAFLTEEEIPFLDIYYRIKKFESFFEKIERKGYVNPFNEIEDICGIRIICYYTTDIQRISKIINKEFNIIEEQDKSDLLGLKEFAYRSKHYIVKIKDSWLVAPNYRKLSGLKAEIQVRTILMHAWAEIEHKLNYKSDSQVPDKFQRKLFRLSAKFEEADEQFEELKDGIENYKFQINEKIRATKSFNLSQDFNIESYRAFVQFHFPEDPLVDFRISHSFEEYKKNNIGFKELDKALQKVKPYFNKISEDLKTSGYSNDMKSIPSELLAISLDITDEKTFNRRFHIENELRIVVGEWRMVVEKWRKLIK
ncbi:MAG: (p)ppGpp synthetase [Bacteroidetes bacterium]|nr:(p)ppGpp synthetase [Bacteroidota bacterium]